MPTADEVTRAIDAPPGRVRELPADGPEAGAEAER